MRNALIVIGMVCILAVLLFWVATQAHNSDPQQATINPVASKAFDTDTKAPEPVVSPWDVSTEKNAVTGEQKITANDSAGNTAIVIRQTGKRLEAYIATDEFLETIDNEDSRDVPVIYRIDSGEPIHQTWNLSADNTAVFYRGDVHAFLRRLQSAKEFDIQIPVSDKEPIVLTFDVHGLPDVFPMRK